MSRFTLFRRLAAAVPALAAACALATPASAADLSLDYKCEWPLLGKRLATVDYATAMPSEWPAGTPTPQWELTADATGKELTARGLELLEIAMFEGAATIGLTVEAPGADPRQVTAILPIPRGNVTGIDPTEVELLAKGVLPSLTFPSPGVGRVTVDSLRYDLKPLRADGSVDTRILRLLPGSAIDIVRETFEVRCELDRVDQDSTLKTFFIVPAGEEIEPPTQPGPGTVTNLTPTSATLTWGASTNQYGVVGYDVYNGLNKLGTTTTTSIDLTGLTPGLVYVIQVVARDAIGNISDERAITFTTPRAPDTLAPSVPTGLTARATDITTVDLSWTASTDNVGVTGYEVFRDGVKVADLAGTTFTASGLNRSTTYLFTVRAKDAAGNLSAQSPAAIVTTPPGGDPIEEYVYALSGSTVLRNLTRGTLPLRGSLTATLDLETQTFEADLKLNATKGTLKALNFLPVSATVSFTNAAKTTGAVGEEQSVTSRSLVNIRLSSVNVFGIPLVAGNCRTQKPSEIKLASQPGFDLLTGGTLTGTYAISNLIDCGPLTILVSPLTAGSGNTITANLTRQ